MKIVLIELIPVLAVICPPNQTVILNDEHSEFAWCSLEEALTLAPFPNQHKVYKHIWEYFIDGAVHPLFQVKLC